VKKKQPGRRFVRKIKGNTVPGLSIEIPDALKGTPKRPQPDTAAVLVCPVCHAVRYISQALLDHMAELQRTARERLAGTEYESVADKMNVAPKHTPCNAIMLSFPLMGYERTPTTIKLARALITAEAPDEMIGKAVTGYYDDFKSQRADNIVALVEDARRAGLSDIMERAIDGEFDSTREESEAWARSPEGQQILGELLKGKDKP